MIQIKDIEFFYGHQKIFSGLTFRLERGSYLVISGPDRSGKTTLVKMLTGMIKPDSGDMIIDGEYIEEIVSSSEKVRELRRKIGGVGGIYSLLNDRTILENVSLSSEISGLRAKAARKSALEACSKYRLSHVSSYYPDVVSKAEKRAALLARAEAAHKNLIIADAPTDGLDDKATRFIHERLAALRLAGTTILYLTTGSGPLNGPDGRLFLRGGRVEK